MEPEIKDTIAELSSDPVDCIENIDTQAATDRAYIAEAIDRDCIEDVLKAGVKESDLVDQWAKAVLRVSAEIQKQNGGVANLELSSVKSLDLYRHSTNGTPLNDNEFAALTRVFKKELSERFKTAQIAKAKGLLEKGDVEGASKAMESAKASSVETGELNTWESLGGANIASDGKLKSLKEQVKEAAYVLAGMALIGQLTLLATRYNMGKTLLTLWLLVQSIKNKQIEPSNLMYINFDDSFEGSITKAEIALQYGFQMVVPGVEGALDAGQIVDAMEYMGKNGQAHGKIVVLDTLKKFTDPMSKTEARSFTSKMRTFGQGGGTLIALSHVNKHKDGEGRSVLEGVGDYASDFDCVYIGDFDTPPDEPKRQVTFRNEKLRGPVKQKVSFTYNASEGANWNERFDSVQMLGASQAQANITALLAHDQRKEDEAIIAYIVGQLTECGPQTYRALILNNLGGDTGSRGQRQKVLERYGPRAAVPELQLWGESRGQKGGTNYYLIEPHEEDEIEV